MKLLFVSNLFPSAVEPDRASYNRQLLGSIARLHDVRIIAPIYRPYGSGLLRRTIPAYLEEHAGFSIVHPRVRYIPRFRVAHHWRNYQRDVREAFVSVTEKFAPDHIMIGFLYPDAVACAELAESTGRSWSVRVNGSDFRLRHPDPAFRPMIERVLSRAPHVFCSGENLADEIAESGVERSRITPIINGVDRDLFAPSDQAREKHFLYVGNLAPVKGVDDLIRAFAGVLSRHPDVRLRLVGAGGERRALESLATDLGCSASLDWLGAKSHRDIANLMRVAHCLCLPSRSEGMPNVILEALATGTPVVASDVGEVSRLIRNEHNGFLVKRDENFVGRLTDALGATLTSTFDSSTIASDPGLRSWGDAASGVMSRVEELISRWSA